MKNSFAGTQIAYGVQRLLNSFNDAHLAQKILSNKSSF
jgi:hypothetical protein